MQFDCDKYKYLKEINVDHFVVICLRSTVHFFYINVVKEGE